MGVLEGFRFTISIVGELVMLLDLQLLIRPRTARFQHNVSLRLMSWFLKRHRLLGISCFGFDLI